MTFLTHVRSAHISILLFTFAVSCGGGSSSSSAAEPGSTHVTPPGEDGDPGAVGTAEGDAGTGAAAAADAAPPRAPVVFLLKNDGKSDLTFALDKGWGGAIFAYSGKPPKAKTVLVFPRYCTGACDAAGGEGAEACPICKEADSPKERQQQEKAETFRQVVPAGQTFELEWDGQVLAYEKASKEIRGKNKKCECFKKAAPEVAEYTVRACGLRTSAEVGKNSKMECVEAQVTLPAAEGTSTDVVLTFGAAKSPDKKSK